MDILIFADGTEVQCSKFLYLSDLGILYVSIPNISWREAVDYFTDAEKTKEMTCGLYSIKGYTNLDYIMPEADGMKARLSPAR